MSRFPWAVFLTAIFGLTGAKHTERISSPPKVEGVYHNVVIGRTAALAPAEGVHHHWKQAHATTNNTLSLKLSDLPVGRVIQIGQLKFVKVGADQYLSISPGCVDPVLTASGAQKLFTYTGNYQSYTFYAGCEYQVELWGAQGNYSPNTSCDNTRNRFGHGAYTSGNLTPDNTVTLYIYTGGHSHDANTLVSAQFNAGSTAYSTRFGAGGGATDVRTISGNWNDVNSLRSRIMVAAGGGGADGSTCGNDRGIYGDGGGLTGYAGGSVTVRGNIDCYTGTATQTAGGSGRAGTSQQGYAGSFGVGGDGGSHSYGAGGGGGWYGGGGNGHSSGYCCGSAGGGSSYISGHAGSIAVSSSSSSSSKCSSGSTTVACSQSWTGYTFTDTVMIDGQGYQWTTSKGAQTLMPNPNGGTYASGCGHTNSGIARITRLN